MQDNKLHVNRKKLMFYFAVLLGISLMFSTSASAEKAKKKTDQPVTRMDEDMNVIPDKYNTGCYDEKRLRKVNSECIKDGIEYTLSNKSVVALDFFYKNKATQTIVLIKNIDFSEMPFGLYNEDRVDQRKIIMFINCKFSTVKTGREDYLISYIFDHCTMEYFVGSNASFHCCKFGDSYQDGLNPFRNVFVNDSYISNMSHNVSGVGYHTDGVQIYGYKDIDAKNIHFKNCRIEAPDIPWDVDKPSYVNSCFAISPEYSNGIDITFENCIINGGGYSIYAAIAEPFHYEDVSIENIKVGCSHKWGVIYPKIGKGITIKEVNDTSKLYVSSVEKKDGVITLSVTNDTNRMRKLIVATKDGLYYYNIPKCPSSDELSKTAITYDKFPFDIKIELPITDWIICYDTSIRPNNQIRYINWLGTELRYPDCINKKLLFMTDVVIK